MGPGSYRDRRDCRFRFDLVAVPIAVPRRACVAASASDSAAVNAFICATTCASVSPLKVSVIMSGRSSFAAQSARDSCPFCLLRPVHHRTNKLRALDRGANAISAVTSFVNHLPSVWRPSWLAHRQRRSPRPILSLTVDFRSEGSRGRLHKQQRMLAGATLPVTRATISLFPITCL